MKNLSVVLATRNEEKNIGRCLKSVKDIADEIIVVDENSTDKTEEIAKKYGAKVFKEPHHEIFHITKQKALERATCKWILQLDADEVVTKKLAKEIDDLVKGEKMPDRPSSLFERHQRIVEQRDGKAGTDIGPVVACYIARKNMFLGKPLVHAGVYPDGVIRLVKKGFARFPQKSVHEQIEISGKVSWLENDLLHYDSPTFKRYLQRMNRYTDLHAAELKEKHIKKNVIEFINYSIFKPTSVFLNLYIRHLGLLDGARGFIWSFFSALHFPVAYYKYWTDN